MKIIVLITDPVEVRKMLRCSPVAVPCGSLRASRRSRSTLTPSPPLEWRLCLL